MDEFTQAAQWEIVEREGRRTIHLSGDWNLLTRGEERQRLASELQAIHLSAELAWDLMGVQVIDSAGALLLWRLWQQHLPPLFDCRPEHQKWFERLDTLEAPQNRGRRAPWWPLYRLGAQLEESFNNAVGTLLLIGQLMVDFAYTLANPRLMPWKDVSASVYHTAATALPLLGVVGVTIGIVMTYQLAMALEGFGANTMIISLLGLSMMRELGPVITALIVIGRTGSTITAKMGVMHVTEEFSALQAFGVSPTQRLVLPNVVGMAISIPLLVIWTDFMGMVGGIITSDLSLGIGYRLFLQRLPEAVPWVNFWIGLGKGVLFGMIIATVSSYFGLKVRANTESLRKETTNSVVTCLAVILILDATLGAMMTNIGLG